MESRKARVFQLAADVAAAKLTDLDAAVQNVQERREETVRRSAMMPPATPIIIHCSINKNGYTFSLSLESRQRVQEEFGENTSRCSRVFIAIGESCSGRIESHVVVPVIQLLVGDSPKGFNKRLVYEFRDPVTDDIIQM